MAHKRCAFLTLTMPMSELHNYDQIFNDAYF